MLAARYRLHFWMQARSQFCRVLFLFPFPTAPSTSSLRLAIPALSFLLIAGPSALLCAAAAPRPRALPWLYYFTESSGELDNGNIAMEIAFDNDVCHHERTLSRLRGEERTGSSSLEALLWRKGTNEDFALLAFRLLPLARPYCEKRRGLSHKQIFPSVACCHAFHLFGGHARCAGGPRLAAALRACIVLTQRDLAWTRRSQLPAPGHPPLLRFPSPPRMRTRNLRIPSMRGGQRRGCKGSRVASLCFFPLLRLFLAQLCPSHPTGSAAFRRVGVTYEAACTIDLNELLDRTPTDARAYDLCPSGQAGQGHGRAGICAP